MAKISLNIQTWPKVFNPTSFADNDHYDLRIPWGGARVCTLHPFVFAVIKMSSHSEWRGRECQTLD